MDFRQELGKEITSSARVRFTRRQIFAARVDQIWTADLCFMLDYAIVNDGYQYIQVCVDIFSRYLWCGGQKTKQALETSNTFETFLQPGIKPKKLFVDRGTEFAGRFKQMLRREGIESYSTYNSPKSAIAERCIRSLRVLIQRHFINTDSTEWFNSLDRIVAQYNDRKHRSIGMTPRQARLKQNHDAVYKKLYVPTPKRVRDLEREKQLFRVGDDVRISTYRRTFEKGTVTWTEEVFKVNKVLPTRPITYQLKDLNEEVIDGSFYNQQLKKTTIVDEFRIDKIVERRTQNGVKEAKVRWFGYSDKFDRWIPESDIT